MLFKNTILTVAISLACVGCSFYSMVYPAWFQQRYKRDGNNVFQGYGLFAFYSTGALDSPFYASVTVLQYSTFCVEDYTTPNYMLGDGDQFHEVLCGKRMMSMKGCMIAGAVTSVVGLLTAIGAVYNPSAGWAERVVSFCTLAASLLQAIALVIWGALIQQTLYQIDSINSAYTTCKADSSKWSCWFYGYSFWVCLASVIMLSIAGYMSSAGRAEKIRYFRKEYERDLAVAVQQSMEADAAATHQMHGAGGPAGNFMRSDTATGFSQPNQYAGGYGQQPAPMQYGQQQQGGYYVDGQKPTGYQQQPVGNVPLSNVNRTQSGQEGDPVVYPSYSEQRRNHSLLGRQPSGGVV